MCGYGWERATRDRIAALPRDGRLPTIPRSTINSRRPPNALDTMPEGQHPDRDRVGHIPRPTVRPTRLTADNILNDFIEALDAGHENTAELVAAWNRRAPFVDRGADSARLWIPERPGDRLTTPLANTVRHMLAASIEGTPIRRLIAPHPTDQATHVRAIRDAVRNGQALPTPFRDDDLLLAKAIVVTEHHLAPVPIDAEHRAHPTRYLPVLEHINASLAAATEELNRTRQTLRTHDQGLRIARIGQGRPADLQVRLNESHQLLRTANEQLRATRSTLAARDLDLLRARRALDEFPALQQGVAGNQQLLTETMDELTQVRHELDTHVAELSDQHAQQHVEFEALQGRFNDSQQRLARTEEQLTATEGRLTAAGEHEALAAANLTQLQAHASELERSNAELRSTVAALREQGVGNRVQAIVSHVLHSLSRGLVPLAGILTWIPMILKFAKEAVIIVFAGLLFVALLLAVMPFALFPFLLLWLAVLDFLDD